MKLVDIWFESGFLRIETPQMRPDVFLSAVEDTTVAILNGLVVRTQWNCSSLSSSPAVPGFVIICLVGMQRVQGVMVGNRTPKVYFSISAAHLMLLFIYLFIFIFFL